MVNLAREAGLKKVPIKSRLGWFDAQKELNNIANERESLYTEFRERTRLYNQGKYSLEEMFPSTSSFPKAVRVNLEEDKD